MKTEQETLDVLVFVEKDGADRFKIRSEQLEQIGEKLRGFSIFNSVILPLMVSAATVFFTGLFQYISWTNEVRLREATEIANRAMKSSAEVAAAIGERYYATYIFMSALRELAAEKPNPETSAPTAYRRSETTGSSGSYSSEPENPDLFAEQNVRLPTAISSLNYNLNKQRYNAYYKQLKKWNESIDTLLTQVDYTFDRPIFIQSIGNQKEAHQNLAGFYPKMNKIDCSEPLTKELKKLKLDTDSLGIRLVGINYCLMRLNASLREHTRANIKSINWTDDYHRQLEDRLSDIATMATQLRCYALHRVDYYNSMKEQSIISPFSVWKWLTNGWKKDAQRHFRDTAMLCDPERRHLLTAAKVSDNGQ